MLMLCIFHKQSEAVEMLELSNMHGNRNGIEIGKFWRGIESRNVTTPPVFLILFLLIK